MDNHIMAVNNISQHIKFSKYYFMHAVIISIFSSKFPVNKMYKH